MSYDKKKIMIVDDNDTFIMYMCILLDRMGYDVVPACSGAEAMKVLKVMKPDLIMINVHMPVLDGVSTLRRIKEDKSLSDTPLFMITSDTTGDAVKKCKDLGCMDYLRKPVRLSDLHYALQEHLFSPLGWKRKHLRINHHMKVSVAYDGEAQEMFTETLSEGGMFLRKKEPLPVGSEVSVTVPMDAGKTLKLKGAVIYTKGLHDDVYFTFPPGMAVEFKDLMGEEAKDLARYVSRLIAEDIVESQEEQVISAEGMERAG